MRDYISVRRRRDKGDTNVCIEPRRGTFNTSPPPLIFLPPARGFHKSEKERRSGLFLNYRGTSAREFLYAEGRILLLNMKTKERKRKKKNALIPT